MTTSIATIAADRSVWSFSPQGKAIAHSGNDSPLLWGGWALRGNQPAAFSWPTWSHDGKKVACFRLVDNDRPTAAVYCLDADGVQAIQISDLGERLPIYLFWSSDNEHIAMLSQSSKRLVLSLLNSRECSRERPLADGSPLFFTWAGPKHIAAFVGHATGPQMVHLGIATGSRATVLPGRPGNFCAPLWLGDQVVFVHHEPGQTHLVASGTTDSEPRFIESVSGLVSMVASPDGRHIARATAPDGDGTPYRRLGVIDIVTGQTRELLDAPCLAFLWTPDGSALITVRVDTQANLLVWHRLDMDGVQTPIAELYPSRDLGFYLRFFEQYSQSHPLMDPTGRFLLLAGNLLNKGDPNGPGRLWRIDTHTGDSEDISDGVFGVYAPAVKA